MVFSNYGKLVGRVSCSIAGCSFERMLLKFIKAGD